jgi:hypothetical protein
MTAFASASLIGSLPNFVTVELNPLEAAPSRFPSWREPGSLPTESVARMLTTIKAAGIDSAYPLPNSGCARLDPGGKRA